TAPARQNHGRGIPPRWTLPLCTAGRHPGLAPQTRRRSSAARNPLLAGDRRTKRNPESRDTSAISSCLRGADEHWRDLWGAQTLGPGSAEPTAASPRTLPSTTIGTPTAARTPTARTRAGIDPAMLS